MAAFPSPPGAVIAYRAQPFERIVDVHWRAVVAGSVINLAWSAEMIDLSGGGAPPLYDPFDGGLNMTVGVTGLPPLSRSLLTVDPVVVPDVDFSTFHDEVDGGPFPDGTGQISGSYTLDQTPFTGLLSGTAHYNTTAARDWFNGAASVVIHITANLRTIGTRDYGGYNWNASATGNAGGSAGLTATKTGTAPSAGTITLTATMQIEPASITLI